MDSLISTFHIDWHLIVAQAINFVIVLLVLYFFALKPLKKLMDERGEKIGQGLKDAEAQKKALADAKAEYDRIVSDARAEGAKVLKIVREDAEKRKAELDAKMQAEFAAAKEENKKQIELAKEQMLREGKAVLAELVMSVSEKVFEGGMSPKIDHEIVEGAIKKINS